MNPILKRVISVFLVIAMALIAYLGSYLPFKKSSGFILTMRSLGATASIADFEKNFSTILDAPSPIGQEELVRQLGSAILSITQQNNDPQIIKKLITFAEKYYDPIIRRNRGMSFSQNLYVLGSINELAYLKTQDPAYFNSAKKYFLKALESGPSRPQSLYGAFDVFRLEGNVPETVKVAEKILSQWPADDRTKTLLQEFLSQADKTKTKAR
ncbi:MAG: hypothetical protein G01um101420_331 [Parcubacteria group bacterium Gr01-1014_20]|nr:MAG: hypothetical protein G01um101420_331 [Parcubacteria group bacterium Gr01-1014_20]